MKMIILITGASSGIGYVTAETLVKQGHKVYGAARRVEKMESLKKYGITPVELDVSDVESCKSCVKEIIGIEGKIDVLVNSAGYGSFGPIEAVPIEEAKYQFDVNVFGLAQMIKEVLPYMRKQEFGKIINISSVGGRVTSHFGGWYHASKYAVEALSDAIRMELKEFGIKVSIIEPSGVKTEWGSIAADHLEKTGKDTVYEKQTTKSAEAMRNQFASDSMFVSSPKVIANVISKAVNSKRPKTRYLVGVPAKIMVFLHTVLPARVFDAIMSKLN